jgi:parvulin-like peptidyl-prolyl isomerase
VPKGEAIIQVTRIVPEHVPTLEEVRDRVEEDYRHDQSGVIAQDKAKQFAQQAKSGDFDKVAKAAGLTAKESKEFSATDYVEGVGSATQFTEAFSMKPGETSGPVSIGSNYVVYRLISHTPANEADFAAQRDQIREELLDQKRNLEFEIYRQNLKQQLERTGELKLYDAPMKQFLEAYQTK